MGGGRLLLFERLCDSAFSSVRWQRNGGSSGRRAKFEHVAGVGSEKSVIIFRPFSCDGTAAGRRRIFLNPSRASASLIALSVAPAQGKRVLQVRAARTTG